MSDEISVEHTTEAVVEQNAETAHSSGISIDPAIVGFQALNFLILLVILRAILYKPLLNLLQTREKKIKEGVENAEQAALLLKKSESEREQIVKAARAEGQSMVDAARQSGEKVRAELLAKAQEEVQHTITAGQNALETEKSKAFSEIKAAAADLILQATEKLMNEKMDAAKDGKLVKEALESYLK